MKWWTAIECLFEVGYLCVEGDTTGTRGSMPLVDEVILTKVY